MKRVYVFVAIAFAAGIAVSALAPRDRAVESPPAATPAAGPFDQDAAVEDRVRALEDAVTQERNARQLLEEELQLLFAELDELRPAGRDRAASPEAAAGDEVITGVAADAAVRRRSGTADESRTDRLVAAGFTPARAEWILQREAELQMEAMQARFEAQRSGDMQALFDAAARNESGLRAELGDAEYEQFLQAEGLPTTVSVRRVLESSPGARAGLLPGDEIVRYDGTRVFSFGELSQELMQGTPGDSVIVDILRDGMPIQVVMPRGPIGIEGGRFRRR